jgi:hypothetical protein
VGADLPGEHTTGDSSSFRASSPLTSCVVEAAGESPFTAGLSAPSFFFFAPAFFFPLVDPPGQSARLACSGAKDSAHRMAAMYHHWSWLADDELGGGCGRSRMAG